MSSAQFNRPAACIAAMGARTSVGLNVESSAIAAKAGISRIEEHPYLVDRAGDPFRIAFDRIIDETCGRIERMQRLASSAIQELLSQFRVSESATIPVYLGLPELSQYFTKQDATSLCRALQADFPCTARIHPITEGGAAGVLALKQALADLATGEVPCSIVGGVDSFVDPDLLEALDEVERLASPSSKWGFPPGEAAAMLLVCSPAFARSCGLTVFANIANIAVTHEPNRMGTETICVGQGLGAAMIQASSVASSPVTKQFCDINGERYREDEFAYAVMRLPQSRFLNAVDYVAPADVWGHTGAATAPLLATLPIVQHRRGFSPGPWPLVWCGSENGQRGALLLHLE